ncbi:MAG: hypothetical protein HMLKMBBP_01546 [Planctomycetes bacterium]|nr:hypothetical protein [Planctomycetota bacterium]
MHWRDLTLDACLYVCRRMREVDRREIFCLRFEEDVDAFALSRWQSSGPKWAVWRDGIPLVIGGINVETPTTGTIWLVATEDSRRAILEATKHIVRFVLPTAAQAGLHRIQALVSTENDAAQRFVEFLGLAREGTLRALGKHGESFYQYAKVTTR